MAVHVVHLISRQGLLRTRKLVKKTYLKAGGYQLESFALAELSMTAVIKNEYSGIILMSIKKQVN